MEQVLELPTPGMKLMNPFKSEKEYFYGKDE